MPRNYGSKLAEREGFEPPVRLRVLRISSATRSTTLPPLRMGLLDSEGRGRCQPPLLTLCSRLGKGLETLTRHSGSCGLGSGIAYPPPENCGGALWALPRFVYAALRASMACGPLLLMAIMRGFRAAGISRFSDTCRRPLSRLAPITSMWSANWKRRSKARPAMP